jgi:hypothetical protein
MSVPNHCTEVNKQPHPMVSRFAWKTHLLTMRNKWIDTNDALLYTMKRMFAPAKQPRTALPATNTA